MISRIRVMLMGLLQRSCKHKNNTQLLNVMEQGRHKTETHMCLGCGGIIHRKYGTEKVQVR